jgi:hypothetical protein
MGGFKSRKIGVKSNGQETVAVGSVHGKEKQLSLDEHGLAAMILTATPRCAALSLEALLFSRRQHFNDGFECSNIV